MASSRISPTDLMFILETYKKRTDSFLTASEVINKDVQSLIDAGDGGGMSGGDQAELHLDNLKKIASTIGNMAGKVEAMSKFIDKKIEEANRISGNKSAAQATGENINEIKKNIQQLAK